MALVKFLYSEITEAAVEVLMTQVEDNPFSEWAALAAELVRAAMNCQGL